MSIEKISLPDLGVDKAEVAEILVKVGDVVSTSDDIVLLESDKASMEVPSPIAGKIVEIHLNVGDKVSAGDDFLTIDADASAEQPTQQNETVSETASEPTAQTETPATATTSNTVTGKQTFTLPDLGVDQAQVSEIFVAVGDTINENDDVVLLESDKASMEVPSPATGTVLEIHCAVGDTLSQGANFITLEVQNAQASDSSPTPSNQETAPQTVAEAPKTVAPSSSTQATSESVTAKSNTSVYAGPAVRKLCRQLGVDIAQVTGTAVNNRIIKEDVHAFVKQQLQKPTPSVGSAVQMGGLPPLPDMSGKEWGATHTEELTKLQKVSIPQLCYNNHIPQVTQFDLADITDTESYRSSIKGNLKKQGISLTIVSFVIKAVAYALKQYPYFNSHLNDEQTHLIMRDEVHIGMAVSTDQGLIVPVIRHADQKGIVQIAQELSEMAGKARDKKIGMSDLTGAGFTISSQGNMGGTYFTPLVNVPQVAILGLSEATMQPRWNADKQTFEPRLMLPLSLSYDHRVINGADAAIFTRYLANLLADPRAILL